jgi:hypothetical protein
MFLLRISISFFYPIAQLFHHPVVDLKLSIARNDQLSHQCHDRKIKALDQCTSTRGTFPLIDLILISLTSIPYHALMIRFSPQSHLFPRPPSHAFVPGPSERSTIPIALSQTLDPSRFSWPKYFS